MLNNVKTKYTGGMAFDSYVDGHTVTVDAVKEVGGEDKGPSPKKLLLTALAGCTGMDVVSLLRKMRVEHTAFVLDIDANLTDEHPKFYDEFTIKYIFTGVKEEDYAKVEKAVHLSEDRYCGVSAMFKKSSKVNIEIIYQ